MALIIQKFGGTSVGDIDRIRECAKLVLRECRAGNQLVVVVSAMAGVTNSLISKCSQVSALSAYEQLQEYDAVVGSGEILTSGLLALELQRIGLRSRSLQGWQIPVITNDSFASARVEFIDDKFLHQLVREGVIPVVTGFQGVTTLGQVTTLGKGGSDTTAALIAAAMKADRADIYTDVTGVFSADPRIVQDVRKIDRISAAQMLDICEYGAKVLHPRAALAVARYQFNMRILSSFEGITDDNFGTLISTEFEEEHENMENRVITAITSNKNILQIELELSGSGFAEVAKDFAASRLNIDKLEFDDGNRVRLLISLADKNKFEAVLDGLKLEGKISGYGIKSNISTVTMIGYGIKSDHGFCFSVIDRLHQEQIHIKAIDVTETRFTAVLEDQDTEKTIRLLHSL